MYPNLCFIGSQLSSSYTYLNTVQTVSSNQFTIHTHTYTHRQTCTYIPRVEKTLSEELFTDVWLEGLWSSTPFASGRQGLWTVRFSQCMDITISIICSGNGATGHFSFLLPWQENQPEEGKIYFGSWFRAGLSSFTALRPERREKLLT